MDSNEIKQYVKECKTTLENVRKRVKLFDSNGNLLDFDQIGYEKYSFIIIPEDIKDDFFYICDQFKWYNIPKTYGKYVKYRQTFIPFDDAEHMVDIIVGIRGRYNDLS